MPDTVIEVEFGKKQRETIRAFARLLGLVEDYEADVQANPAKYIAMAREEIAWMRRRIEDAREVARRPVRAIAADEPIGPLKTVVVPADEWEALQKMRDIVFSTEYGRQDQCS